MTGISIAGFKLEALNLKPQLRAIVMACSAAYIGMLWPRQSGALFKSVKPEAEASQPKPGPRRSRRFRNLRGSSKHELGCKVCRIRTPAANH